jgi:hypothetical protein
MKCCEVVLRRLPRFVVALSYCYYGDSRRRLLSVERRLVVDE